MSDFVDYEPWARSPRAGTAVTIRAASQADAGELSAVMAARGGTVEEHSDRARRLVERLPVLSVAEMDVGLVGWSGAQPFVIETDSKPEWLIAGLAVIRAQRRRGIAASLLGDVLKKVRHLVPGEPIFSVINARNEASIDLHKGLGFQEVARGATFARIEFTGGEGVLLKHS